MWKCLGVYVENEYHILFRCSAYFDLKLAYNIPDNYILEPYIAKSYHLYENMCVCLFAFFSAIWNSIGIPFGTKLVLGPVKVLNQ